MCVFLLVLFLVGSFGGGVGLGLSGLWVWVVGFWLWVLGCEVWSLGVEFRLCCVVLWRVRRRRRVVYGWVLVVEVLRRVWVCRSLRSRVIVCLWVESIWRWWFVMVVWLFGICWWLCIILIGFCVIWRCSSMSRFWLIVGVFWSWMGSLWRCIFFWGSVSWRWRVMMRLLLICSEFIVWLRSSGWILGMIFLVFFELWRRSVGIVLRSGVFIRRVSCIFIFLGLLLWSVRGSWKSVSEIMRVMRMIVMFGFSRFVLRLSMISIWWIWMSFFFRWMRRGRSEIFLIICVVRLVLSWCGSCVLCLVVLFMIVRILRSICSVWVILILWFGVFWFRNSLFLIWLWRRLLMYLFLRMVGWRIIEVFCFIWCFGLGEFWVEVFGFYI